jgi:hypothetical protein
VFFGDLVPLLRGAAFRFLSRCFEIEKDGKIEHIIKHHGHIFRTTAMANYGCLSRNKANFDFLVKT